MKYIITLEIDTDKELTELEQESLSNLLYLEVEEPRVRNTDETTVNTYDDAEWRCVRTPLITIVQA